VSDNGKAERAVDLLVYAPVGVALYLRDTVPTFVNLFRVAGAGPSSGNGVSRRRTRSRRRRRWGSSR